LACHMLDRNADRLAHPLTNIFARPRSAAVLALLSAALLWPAQGALAQFTQQGPKLVGTGPVGKALQGHSVALSGDGNTAIMGGAGAAWMFTRSGGQWRQEGAKLVGSGAVGAAYQGYSVALSGDGNTAIMGGPDDNGSAGAAWVFTRSGGQWRQEGAKLVGSGAVGAAYQGYSVALSGDGNTAIVGGYTDNSSVGAAWVFTRNGGVWGQQAKLVGTGWVGRAEQGWSVALSGDGNTAIVGGLSDSRFAGAAWVFTRSGGQWRQQGAKLVGSGAVGAAQQGYSVALSGDGNTAIVGGPADNSGGAVWVFTRSGGLWSQQAKLVGTGGVGFGQRQGDSVALSGDGNTAIAGGPDDNDNTGAAWVFTRSGGQWSQQGAKLVGTGASAQGSPAGSTTPVALSGDGNTAIVGRPNHNADIGAAWVFTRSGGR
jgi:uncharacterized protein YdbL (DUF1318 family)